jgi:hypothetical protein
MFMKYCRQFIAAEAAVRPDVEEFELGGHDPSQVVRILRKIVQQHGEVVDCVQSFESLCLLLLQPLQPGSVVQIATEFDSVMPCIYELRRKGRNIPRAEFWILKIMQMHVLFLCLDTSMNRASFSAASAHLGKLLTVACKVFAPLVSTKDLQNPTSPISLSSFSPLMAHVQLQRALFYLSQGVVSKAEFILKDVEDSIKTSKSNDNMCVEFMHAKSKTFLFHLWRANIAEIKTERFKMARAFQWFNQSLKIQAFIKLSLYCFHRKQLTLAAKHGVQVMKRRAISQLKIYRDSMQRLKQAVGYFRNNLKMSAFRVWGNYRRQRLRKHGCMRRAAEHWTKKAKVGAIEKIRQNANSQKLLKRAVELTKAIENRILLVTFSAWITHYRHFCQLRAAATMIQCRYRGRARVAAFDLFKRSCSYGFYYEAEVLRRIMNIKGTYFLVVVHQKYLDFSIILYDMQCSSYFKLEVPEQLLLLLLQHHASLCRHVMTRDWIVQKLLLMIEVQALSEPRCIGIQFPDSGAGEVVPSIQGCIVERTVVPFQGSRASRSIVEWYRTKKWLVLNSGFQEVYTARVISSATNAFVQSVFSEACKSVAEARLLKTDCHIRAKRLESPVVDVADIYMGSYFQAYIALYEGEHKMITIPLNIINLYFILTFATATAKQQEQDLVSRVSRRCLVKVFKKIDVNKLTKLRKEMLANQVAQQPDADSNEIIFVPSSCGIQYPVRSYTAILRALNDVKNTVNRHFQNILSRVDHFRDAAMQRISMSLQDIRTLNREFAGLYEAVSECEQWGETLGSENMHKIDDANFVFAKTIRFRQQSVEHAFQVLNDIVQLCYGHIYQCRNKCEFAGKQKEVIKTFRVGAVWGLSIAHATCVNSILTVQAKDEAFWYQRKLRMGCKAARDADGVEEAERLMIETEKAMKCAVSEYQKRRKLFSYLAHRQNSTLHTLEAHFERSRAEFDDLQQHFERVLRYLQNRRTRNQDIWSHIILDCQQQCERNRFEMIANQHKEVPLEDRIAEIERKRLAFVRNRQHKIKTQREYYVHLVQEREEHKKERRSQLKATANRGTDRGRLDQTWAAVTKEIFRLFRIIAQVHVFFTMPKFRLNLFIHLPSVLRLQ